jgi:hypothetical protein
MNINDAIAEIQQPRSRYQLIHFVIGQHDTAEMRFYQLVLELQDTGYKLRLAEIAVQKAEVEIARLLETGDELDALDAEEKRLGMKQTLTVMKGAQREMAILEDIFDSCEHYTRDEIEHAQPEYWQKRLTRQTNLQIMSGGVQWAQLDSMRQIGMLDELIATRETQLLEASKLEIEP